MTYLGTGDADTLVVDYLLPINSPSPFETRALIALDASLAGIPYDIYGSQLHQSTITDIENITINVEGSYSLWLYGDHAANVITLNVDAGSSGSKTVLANGGDDTIISNNHSCVHH